MIILKFLALAFVATVRPAAPNASPVPAIQQSGCEIHTPSWCLLELQGEATVVTGDNSSRWSILDNLVMPDGPMLVTQTGLCSTADLEARKIRGLPDSKGGVYETVTYSLNRQNTCQIEFKLPARNGVVNPAYIHKMLYGVAICPKDRCDFQLYKLEATAR